jgi:hypothetical protein
VDDMLLKRPSGLKAATGENPNVFKEQKVNFQQQQWNSFVTR